MENKIKYFYCYSSKLRRFIVESGINWTDRGVHNKTGHPFWVFVDNEKLNKILNKYKKEK